MNEKIAELVKPLAKRASKLNLSKARTSEELPLTGTHFGGEPYSEADEEYPVCPTCRVPLTFICQINTAEGFHKKHAGIKLFTFFYCWECSPGGYSEEEKGQWLVRIYAQPDAEKFVPSRPESEIKLPTDPCLASIEEIIVYPKWEEIDYWAEGVTDLAREANEESPWEEYDSTVKSLGGFNDFATTIGGYALWVQSEEISYCKICGKTMSLLAQIDSESDAGLGWGDVGLIYLFMCEDHLAETKLVGQCF